MMLVLPSLGKKPHQYTIKCAGKIYLHTLHAYKFCQYAHIPIAVYKSTCS